MNDIVIAAALIIREKGDTLLVRKRGTLVRKRGTTAFLQPGGKIEPGETPEEALTRELQEEIGLVVDLSKLIALGRFQADAANEPGRRVVAHVFRLDIDDEATVEPAAEIDAIAWISADQSPDIPMAPLTEAILLPLYRQIISGSRT